MSRAGALGFLVRRRLANRLRSAREKLRRPKYLIGAILVGLYFGMMVFARIASELVRVPRLATGAPPAVGGTAGAALAAVSPAEAPAAVSSTGPLLALALELGFPVALFLLALWAWAPVGSGPRIHPLGFEKADAHLLFPAPLARWSLLAYRMAAIQIPLLLSSFLFGFVVRRGGTLASVAGFQVFLNVLWLHRVSAALAHGVPSEAALWRRALAWAPGVLLAAGFAALVLTANLDPTALAGADPVAEVRRASESGLMPWVLLPFSAIAQTVAARDGPILGHGSAFLVALAILGMHIVWLVAVRTPFQETCLTSAELRDEVRSAIRKGRFRPGFLKNRGRPVRTRPFGLAPRGTATMAFAWKAILAGGRTWTPGYLVLALIGAGVSGRVVGALDLGVPPWFVPILVGVVAAMIPANLLLSPSREGIGTIDTMALLRPLPVRGHSVVGGIVLGETAVGLVWLTLIAAFGVGWGAALLPPGELGRLAAIVAASLVPAAAVMLLATSLRASIVLLLPTVGRVEIGPEAIGSNFLAMIVRSLGLSVLGGPVAVAALAGGVLVGVIAGMPAGWIGAGAAATLVLLLESVGLVLLGGRFYDRFDITAERL